MILEEIKEQIKSEYPTLRIGDDERGYIDLTVEEYETTINIWAENALAKQQKAEMEESKKAAAFAKLQALGLDEDDLKALGL